MAIWSSIFRNNVSKVNAVRHLLSRSGNGLTSKGINKVPARYSGHDTLVIRDSQFDYTKLKDIINFYLLLLGIPIGAAITYINIFIGPAKLAIPPEGYVPNHWEYHEHPISRFIARYIITSPQEVYERKLHSAFVNYERHLLSRLEHKVKRLIKERSDYQAWYYEGFDNTIHKVSRERYEKFDFDLGGRKYHSI